MSNRHNLFIIVILTALVTVILTACGGSDRTGDAAPVREVVPTQPATTEPAPGAVEAGGDASATPAESEAPAGSDAAAGQTDPIFTFSLSGGVVGFCDTLTVNGAGDYRLQSCDGEEQTGTIDDDRRALLQTWQNDLTAFNLTAGDDGTDGLQSELVFNGVGSAEADEVQRQIIFDWVNGLLIQVRPQPVAEPPPTPEPPQIGPDGLCPDVNRPAVLIANYDDPSRLYLVDPTGTQCDVMLPQPPVGRIVTAMGYIYFPIFDPEAETIAIWRLAPSGETSPLEFTTVTVEMFGPFNFTVSADGNRIAWAQTAINFDVEPPEYTNSMWLANIDGSGQETIMEQVSNDKQRYVEPVQFGPASGRLFYAFQPDALSGTIFSYGGRYDNLYALDAGQTDGNLLFDCATVGTELCIGDIAPDGLSLVYTNPAENTVNLFDIDSGQVAQTFTSPAANINYVGPAVFNDAGSLAFISGVLTEPDDEGFQTTSPGHIGLITPPYTDGVQTLLEGDNISAVWEWVTDDQLSYGRMDEERNIGTSLVSQAGQSTDLSSNFPLAVLR